MVINEVKNLLRLFIIILLNLLLFSLFDLCFLQKELSDRNFDCSKRVINPRDNLFRNNLDSG